MPLGSGAGHHWGGCVFVCILTWESSCIHRHRKWIREQSSRFCDLGLDGNVQYGDWPARRRTDGKTLVVYKAEGLGNHMCCTVSNWTGNKEKPIAVVFIMGAFWIADLWKLCAVRSHRAVKQGRPEAEKSIKFSFWMWYPRKGLLGCHTRQTKFPTGTSAWNPKPYELVLRATFQEPPYCWHVCVKVH